MVQQLKAFITSQQERLKTFENDEMKSYQPQREKNKSEEEGSFFESSVDSGLESTIVNDIVEEL